MRVFGYISAVLLCVLVGSLGTLMLTQGVQADAVDGLRVPITYVKMAFAKDHLEQHGRKIKSYHFSGGTWERLCTVPEGQRFIMTDIVLGHNAWTEVTIKNDSDEVKFRCWTDGNDGTESISLTSGVVFEPSEDIWIATNYSTTVSGYFLNVD